jgi:hypothetical protein
VLLSWCRWEHPCAQLPCLLWTPVPREERCTQHKQRRTAHACGHQRFQQLGPQAGGVPLLLLCWRTWSLLFSVTPLLGAMQPCGYSHSVALHGAGTHAAASVQCVVWSDCTMQGVFMRGHMSGWLPTHPTQCAAGVRLRRMLPVGGLVSSTCGLSLQHNSGLQSFKCPSCKRRWRSCCCWLGRRHHPRPAHASLYVDRPGCGCGSDRLWPHSNA